MSGLKIGAILLIVAGTLGLAYGTFSYTRQTHHASMGPMELSVSEERTVNVPVWAGVGAIVVGAVLLLVRKKSKA
jgi:LPXTG-motif cell wall-anchored protein